MRVLRTEAQERGVEARETLTLAFDQRCKSRLRARLDSGEEVALLLTRGQVLRGGDCLVADDGTVVRVHARPELVSTVHTHDARALARVAYHLGNRHVAVEVGADGLRYQHDHVLDEMVRGLGLSVQVQEAPFEPEGGAYGDSGHAHAHAHPHDATHTHPPAADADTAEHTHPGSE